MPACATNSDQLGVDRTDVGLAHRARVVVEQTGHFRGAFDQRFQIRPGDVPALEVGRDFQVAVEREQLVDHRRGGVFVAQR